jgi:heme iron utilization protein
VEKQGLLVTIKSLFAQHGLGVLATAGDSYPYTSLIAFAATEDLRGLVFATLRATHKYKNMLKNPCVSFLINSAINQAQDLKDAVAVTVLGKVADVDQNRREHYRTLLVKKHPDLHQFLNEKDCAVMMLSVDKYVYVDSFQHVQELGMKTSSGV